MMSLSELPDSWINRSVGDRQRYLLKQRIGGGGMGEVFLATDTLLDQPVALKLLNNQLAAEMRKRFEREVAVCAALRSSHIVKVIDYGMTIEGYPFYVMEYLRGQTLGQLLHRERRFSVERSIRLMAQICAGLSLAHQGIDLKRDGATVSEHVKVVHRDLKPDNIFVMPTALGEFVKILDFGIAKLRHEQAGHTNVTNVFMGTYQYAAPEQIQVHHALDERADIYSLGMILYEMLSGTDPFSFKLEQRAEPRPSGVVWAVVHLTEQPLPLRSQPNCEQLPPELEAIVMRCLEKSPERRFASVVELDQALRMIAPQVSDREILNSHQEQKPFDRANAHPPVQTLINAQWRLRHNSVTYDLNCELNTVIYQSTEAPKRFQRIPALLGGGLTTALVLAFGLSSLGAFALLKSEPEPPSLRESASLQPMSPQVSATEDLSAQPAPDLINTLRGHADTVWAVAVSPDGQTLASGSFDRTIRLWDLPTATVRHTLEGHTDAVRAIAFSPDGQIFASGSSDATVKVWDAATGELRHTLTGQPGAIWSIAISPDSKMLASGSYDGTIRIWDLQTGALLQTLPENYDSIWSIAISPDSKTLASGSYDGTIRIWDLQTGALLQTLDDHLEAVRSIAISPDGQTLVSGSWDKTIKIWNYETGELRHTLTGHGDRVLSVAISPDGQTIASGSSDRTLKLWDLETGTLRRTLLGHADWVLSIAFAPLETETLTSRSEKILVSGSKDRTIKIWHY